MMKNGLVFFSLLMVLAWGVSAQAELLVNGDFEEGDTGSLSDGVPGWEKWGSTGWHHSDAGVRFGEKGMKFWWNTCGIWQDFDAAPDTVYALSVQVMDSSTDTTPNSWDLQIEVEFYDASETLISATILDIFDSSVELDDTWVEIGDSIVAPEDTAHGRVLLRLTDWQSDILGGIYFDNVSVVNANNPLLAHDPDPAFDASGVGTLIGDGTVDVTLNWLAGLDPNDASLVNSEILKHYVYLQDSTDPNLYFQGDVDCVSLTDPNASMVLTGLNEGSVYYWKVEEGVNNGEEGAYLPGDANNLDGNLWMFKTASSIPAIGTQPVKANIPLGQTGDSVFSIETDSVTVVSYQWFSSTDEEIDETDTAIVGSTEATLTIEDVALTDEGYYYCRVSNDATFSGGGSEEDLYSDVVPLVIGRLVGEYLFEENLLDNTTEGNDGLAKDISLADPNEAVMVYAEGIEGDFALELNGSSYYVDLGVEAFPKAGSFLNGVGSGLDEGTISCWTKASKVGGLFANYNTESDTGLGLFLVSSDGDVNAWVHLRDEAGNLGTAQGRPGLTGFDMLDGQWHMVSVTWKEGGTIYVYVDGGEVDATDASVMDEFMAWEESVIIGANRGSGPSGLEAFYGGLIDSMRIYNYVRTPNQMANEYYTLTGLPACIDPDFVGSAYNFDNSSSSYCKVDLSDFAIFAQQWLSNGLF